MHHTQSKFFVNFANLGERIGEMNKDMENLRSTHDVKRKNLTDKQEALFAKKDFQKWENPQVQRMNKTDQDELLRNKNNMNLIGV